MQVCALSLSWVFFVLKKIYILRHLLHSSQTKVLVACFQWHQNWLGGSHWPFKTSVLKPWETESWKIWPWKCTGPQRLIWSSEQKKQERHSFQSEKKRTASSSSFKLPSSCHFESQLMSVSVFIIKPRVNMLENNSLRQLTLTHTPQLSQAFIYFEIMLHNRVHNCPTRYCSRTIMCFDLPLSFSMVMHSSHGCKTSGMSVFFEFQVGVRSKAMACA